MTIRIDEPLAARAFEEILTAVGRAADRSENLAIYGREACLPSAFPVASLGAAALAACGIALNDLWYLAHGRKQAVAIGLMPAAASLRSTNLMCFQNGYSPDLFEPLFGYYRTGDERWIQLHTNFPHTRDRALSVLGAEANRERVAAAVATWKGLELEQALTETGACAALVRTPAEWEAHAQSAAIQSLPLISIRRIADSAPEPLTRGPRPLSGLRVLDLTRVLAGPTCGRTLAEHGAEVMRISAPHLPSVERCVIDTGHGKRAAHLDLRDAAGLQDLYNLVEQADCFCQAYRPGSLAARGLSPEALAERRPGLIYLSLNAYGQRGPWCERRGYDTLVQCTTGIAHEHGAGPHGAAGDKPAHLPGAVLDYVTGYLAAFGAMHALYLRTTQGGSYTVEVSLAQTAHWLKCFPRLASEAYASVPAIEIEHAKNWMTESETAWGRLRHLGPVLELSETPGYWAQPVVPLGTDPARWQIQAK